MFQFVRDLFSTPDNKHWELSRVGTGIGAVSGIAMQVYAIVKGQTFDMSVFGIGFSALLAGGGIGTALKDRARTNDINVNIDTSGQ